MLRFGRVETRGPECDAKRPPPLAAGEYRAETSRDKKKAKPPGAPGALPARRLFMESLESVQAGINVALSRSIMEMQSNLAAALINGSLQAPADGARDAGLAAEGIGTKLNTVA